jgi:hypothetical protein
VLDFGGPVKDENPEDGYILDAYMHLAMAEDFALDLLNDEKASDDDKLLADVITRIAEALRMQAARGEPSARSA